MMRDDERKISSLLEALHHKDLDIKSKEEVVRERNLEIQRLDEVIHNKEKEIEDRDAIIHARDAEVRSRDESIRRLERRMVEARIDEERRESRFATLAEEMPSQTEITDRLRGEAENQAQQINDMNRKADAAYSNLQTLTHQLRISKARLADMESSRSWRITQPIRAIRSAFNAWQSGNSDRANDRRWEFGAPNHQQDRSTAFLSSVASTSVQEALDSPASINLASQRSSTKPRFDLRGCQMPIVILTTPHCTYVAEEIAAALRQIDVDSRIIYDVPGEGYDDVPHFVICPQMFERLPDLYVSFQMEQSVSSRWFTPKYLRKLELSFAVLDYSLINIAKLKNMGLSNRQMYHLPIGYLENFDTGSEAGSAEYDVIFYGDIKNARRREFIVELSNVCKVKVINDLFGVRLRAELARARLVVNIHYYAGALLETTRLWECLSLGKLVVSERSADMDQHDDLVDLVDFVDVDDVAGMVEHVRYWLSNEALRQQRLQQNKKSMRIMPNRFDMHFYRFLLATDNIKLGEFLNLAGGKMKLGG